MTKLSQGSIGWALLLGSVGLALLTYGKWNPDHDDLQDWKEGYRAGWEAAQQLQPVAEEQPHEGENELTDKQRQHRWSEHFAHETAIREAGSAPEKREAERRAQEEQGILALAGSHPLALNPPEGRVFLRCLACERA